MPFVLQPQKDVQAWWPVVIKEPTDGGKTAEAEFELLMVGAEDAEVKGLGLKSSLTDLQALQAGEMDFETFEDKNADRQAKITEFLLAHVKDWRGVNDPAGKPIKFSQDKFKMMLTMADKYQLAIHQAYTEFRSGRREKN